MKKPLYVKDHAYFQKAMELAESGEHRVRVGCLATVGTKIVAGGFNTYRNSPAYSEYGNATYHAERNVLTMVSPRLLPKVTLYIARITKGDVPVPSFPCSTCLKEIKVARIESLVYMDRNYNLAKERLL